MTYDEYRQKMKYVKRYGAKATTKVTTNALNGYNYYELSEYDRETYKKLATLRRMAETNKIEIKKLTSQNRYILIAPDGLTKFFNDLESLEDFLYTFDIVNKYFC